MLIDTNNAAKDRWGCGAVALTIPAVVVAFVLFVGLDILFSRWTADEGTPAIVAMFAATAIYFVAYRRMARRSAGSTIVRSIFALLVILVAFGINLPNQIGSAQRMRQKETMRRMRAISDALERYAAAHRDYPVADSVAAVDPNLPRDDDWSHPFVLHSRAEGYIVISYGLGGAPDVRSASEYQKGETTRPEQDLVLTDGEFLRYPQGAQAQ